MIAADLRLSDLKPGQRATIQHFDRESPTLYRLMEMGLLPGTEVVFVREAPLGDPLEFEVRGGHLSLRRAEAACIAVATAAVA